MCLDYVISKSPDLNKKERPKIGYKTFIKREDGSFGTGYYGSHIRFWRGKWKIDENQHGPHDYEAGFHVWKTLAGARYWADSCDFICKVEYTHTTAEGLQNSHRAVCAKRIKIVKIMKRGK